MVQELLLDDLRVECLRTVTAGDPLERAFAEWVTRQACNVPLDQLLADAASHAGAQRSYRDVAMLGYGIASGLRDDSIIAAFSDALSWLLARTPFPSGIAAGFEEDPIALLGIALGVLSTPSDPQAVREWFALFLPRSHQIFASEPAARLLLAVAEAVLDGQSAVIEARVPDMELGLASTGIKFAEPTVEEGEAFAVIRSVVTKDPARAAARIAALDWLRREAPVILPGRGTVEDVIRLLARLPSAFARWTWEEKPRVPKAEPRKWYVDHEYHVQNALWAILAPVFPDLKPEDVTPQVGQKQPRADLGIPSLKLIIEVKVLRASDSFAKLIEEISADAGLYLVAGSSYTSVIAVVWDESRRTEQYDRFREGLKQVHGITDVIVLPRPGAMR